MQNDFKHWSKVEYLHESVTNPFITVKGKHSYYSDAWTGSFETSVVRYLYGDAFSRAAWEPAWEIDRLYIGDYVCIGAEAVILMGGNHTHPIEWFSLYPFIETIVEAYAGKGDTIIHDGSWIGMRAMIMPGITIGEGAIVAANSVVTKNVEPYTIVAGNPAKPVRLRFEQATIDRLLALKIYDLPEADFKTIQKYMSGSDIGALEEAVSKLTLK